MSIIRMINIGATQSERLALRCIDLVTGPMLIKPDHEVSINGIRHDEQAIRILLHREVGDK